MIRLKILSFFLFVFIVKSQQLQWVKAQKESIGIPSSIQIFKLSTLNSPFNTKLTGAYARFDFRDQNLEFKVVHSDGRKHKTPMKWAQVDQNIVYSVINGGFFDMTTHASQSFICSDNQVYYPNSNNAVHQQSIYPTVGAIGALQNGKFDIQWIYSFKQNFETYAYTQPNKYPGPEPNKQQGTLWKVKQGLGAGPILLKNGDLIRKNAQNFNHTIIGQRVRQPRSGVCYDSEGRLLFIVIDGRYDQSKGVTLGQFAIILQDLGCLDALNLDGGGSSLLYANNYVVNHLNSKNPRRVVSALVVRDKYIKKKPLIVLNDDLMIKNKLKSQEEKNKQILDEKVGLNVSLQINNQKISEQNLSKQAQKNQDEQNNIATPIYNIRKQQKNLKIDQPIPNK